jgi:hypothetical protein
MGSTTDIRELRSKAKDLSMIASYKESVIWFWRRAETSNEMMEIINRVELLLDKIQSSRVPNDSVEIVRAGQQIQACAKKAIKITEDGTPMNRMMKQFVEVLGYEDVQSSKSEERQDNR